MPVLEAQSSREEMEPVAPRSIGKIRNLFTDNDVDSSFPFQLLPVNAVALLLVAVRNKRVSSFPLPPPSSTSPIETATGPVESIRMRSDSNSPITHNNSMPFHLEICETLTGTKGKNNLRVSEQRTVDKKVTNPPRSRRTYTRCCCFLS